MIEDNPQEIEVDDIFVPDYQKESTARVGRMNCFGATVIIICVFVILLGGILGAAYILVMPRKEIIYQIVVPTATETVAFAEPTQIPPTIIPVTETPVPAPLEPTATVTPVVICQVSVVLPDDTTARVRNGPGTSFNVLRTVPNGTVFTYNGTNNTGEWTLIGNNEWIKTSLLTSPRCSY